MHTECSVGREVRAALIGWSWEKCTHACRGRVVEGTWCPLRKWKELGGIFIAEANVVSCMFCACEV